MTSHADESTPVAEEGCEGSTFERKYYRSGLSYIKRSLRPHEYRQGYYGIHKPRLAKERLQNEAECLRFIQRQTNIPVPTVYADFEDDGAYYLITELIDGIDMSEVEEKDKQPIFAELDRHLSTLHSLKSSRLGGPSGLVVTSTRLMAITDQDKWDLQRSDTEDYVFCHNDLSEYNIIVDRTTHKIKAILDWEFAGFYPPFFEAPVYTRRGPRAQSTNDDAANVTRMLEFLHSHETRATPHAS